MIIEKGSETAMLNIPYYEREPIFDILPVHKTRFFYGGRKQLLYARTAFVRDDGFYFDLQKFERDPVLSAPGSFSDTDSAVAVSFDFSKTGTGPVFTALLNRAGSHAVYIDSKEQSGYRFEEVYAYRGEDEQGWYWGVRILISLCMLSSVYPPTAFSPGDVVRGNAYAVMKEGPDAHFSAVSPFSEPSVFHIDNLHDFQINNR